MIGRFTQEDTYRGDGLNLYAYCGNNPVVYYDPSGHNMSDYEVQPVAEPEKPKSANNSGLYSDEELIDAAGSIHDAQYGDAWWGKKNPVTVTQVVDGTVVVSKNNGIIGPKSRQRAVEIFGDDVIIVGGRGANFDNTRWGAFTDSPNHAEARGLQGLLSQGINTSNAKQATTLSSCMECIELQNQLGVINLTGGVHS